MFRRETIIALRARHEAHRIASDILYPQIDVPPPPEPGIPAPDPRVELMRPRPTWKARLWTLAWVVAALVLAGELLILLYYLQLVRVP